MKYERIFWLEDLPHSVLPYLKLGDVDMDEFFDKTTFAFDYQQGKDVLQNGEEFDLYVLDGDFPDMLSEERRGFLSNYVRDFFLGKTVSHEDALRLEGDESRYGKEWALNFQRFFMENLESVKEKVVIYSREILVGVAGNALGLPVYCKRNYVDLEERDKLIDKIVQENNLEMAKRMIYGTRREFIQEHLS
jgi:hypothetical protein